MTTFGEFLMTVVSVFLILVFLALMLGFLYTMVHLLARLVWWIMRKVRSRYD